MTDLLAGILSPPRAFAALLPKVVIRSSPEDFRVDELPLYEPCGSGEHAYLLVEKRNVAAGQLIQQVSRSFRIAQRDIGVAGQKDKRAITRQTISVPATSLPNAVSAVDRSIKVLRVDLHTNKLRTGHLSGNRFEITLRPVSDATFQPDDASSVKERLKTLETEGFPNYFGTQRFGHGGTTVTKGLDILHAAEDAGGKTRGGKRFINKMAISAVQSAVFNLVLAGRVRNDTFRHSVPGDVVCRRGGTKPFLLTSESDSPIDELIPMGPMPGPKMIHAGELVREDEDRVTRSLGVNASSFAALRKIAPGTRRKMVEFPADTDATLLQDGELKCSFVLPAGSYATVLLAEIAHGLVEQPSSTLG